MEFSETRMQNASPDPENCKRKLLKDKKRELEYRKRLDLEYEILDLVTEDHV